MLQKLKNELINICSVESIAKLRIVATVAGDNRNAKNPVFSKTNPLFLRCRLPILINCDEHNYCPDKQCFIWISSSNTAV